MVSRISRRSSFRASRAAVVSVGLVLAAIFLAAVTKSGDGFAPRVPTIDALAGLAAGAFLVDRLLTFVPPWPADTDKSGHRAADLDTLRWGWGALIGAGFVLATGLRAVAALTNTTQPIDPHIDRVIAVLAIAGGVKGLARIKDALNPPPVRTNPPNDPPTDQLAGTTTYVLGLLALAVACMIAAVFHGDHRGIELLTQDQQADGTIALVVRFGPLLLAAAVIEQLVERSFASSITGAPKKVLTGAASVILGVIAARLMDLYLLHNLGFFKTASGTGALNTALAASSNTERWIDVVVTGLVIAAGTAPLHDLAAALAPSDDE
jgi:hypothetical protein